MDTSFDTEFATQSLHLQATVPPPRAPRWVAAVGVLTLALAAGSVLCVALLFGQSASTAIAAPAAVIMATLALGCGVAAVVGRHVHGAMIGKLDLLEELVNAFCA